MIWFILIKKYFFLCSYQPFSKRFFILVFKILMQNLSFFDLEKRLSTYEDQENDYRNIFEFEFETKTYSSSESERTISWPYFLREWNMSSEKCFLWLVTELRPKGTYIVIKFAEFQSFLWQRSNQVSLIFSYLLIYYFFCPFPSAQYY